MNIMAIVMAAAVIAVVGIVVGIGLGLFGEKFKVEVDEKELGDPGGASRQQLRRLRLRRL